MTAVRGALPQAATLRDLVDRVAMNRVSAGLRYPKDNKGGVVVADALFEILMKRRSKIETLIYRAKKDSFQCEPQGRLHVKRALTRV